MAGSTGGGGGRKPGGNAKGATVIENLAQTKRLAETALGGPSSIPTPKSNNVDDEKLTNTGSGSQVRRILLVHDLFPISRSGLLGIHVNGEGHLEGCPFPIFLPVT